MEIMSIIFHVIGVIAIINVITFFLAGQDRHTISKQAFIITFPLSIAYVIWLIV